MLLLRCSPVISKVLFLAALSDICAFTEYATSGQCQWDNEELMLLERFFEAKVRRLRTFFPMTFNATFVVHVQLQLSFSDT